MRFLELTLLTAALDAQRAFYAHRLGLPEVSGAPDALTLQVGHTRLVFAPASIDAPAPAGWRGVYHFAFNIPENQLAEAKTWLSQHTSLLKDETGADEFDFANWNAHAVYFYDPAGNIVELIARHDLPTASARPFDAHSLLNVSEIGVSVADVPATARALQAGLSAPIYDGAGSETFTAVGDTEGLFIVVKRGRMWYPNTGRRAGDEPVRAILERPDGHAYTWATPSQL